MSTETNLLFGIDQLLRTRLSALAGLRVGLVTNDAATTAIAPAPLVPSRLALQQAGVNLVALFAPEHGLGVSAAEGVTIHDQVDPLTGLPVYSLYGVTERPTPAMLANLDLLLFDIPDIGARFYTYIWTLSHVLEACAAQQLPLWVLDRPNPLSGNLAYAEGPMLDEVEFSTFVGRWAIPIRHSLTVGELARLWNEERHLQAPLTVVPLQNWQRSTFWVQTGLPFVPTSPNLPDAETALLYPGLCLFEGVNISEGRGTTLPFRQVGAPWFDGRQVATAFNELALPGVRARAVTFTPTSSKYAGQLCQGVMLHTIAPAQLRPVAACLHLLALIRQLHGPVFAWLPPVAGFAYNHFDRLVGQRALRERLTYASSATNAPIAKWTETGDWAQRVTPYLLYP